jgi:hypothetical protein
MVSDQMKAFYKFQRNRMVTEDFQFARPFMIIRAPVKAKTLPFQMFPDNTTTGNLMAWPLPLYLSKQINHRERGQKDDEL